MNATDEKLGILIGGLQFLSTISDDDANEYLQGSGLRSIIESATGFRSPYILIVDDNRIHASGPKMIDELFDDLVLENKLQAANELKNRLMILYVDLRTIDEASNRAPLDESLANAIQDAKQVALELMLFTMKLRKALLTPPLDPIELAVTGNLFRLYQILKHRKGIWSEYGELSDTMEVEEKSIERYLRKLDAAILEHGKTVDRPRGENKCRLESISDESIRK